jgi:hypothetical protein
MTKTKIKKCIAGVSVEKCIYKKDSNRLNREFNSNRRQHKDFRDTITSMNNNLNSLISIRLNGDDKTTPLPEVLKEMYHVTLSLRKTNKLKEAFNDWRLNTKVGKVFETKIGKIAGSFILLWVILSSLNTLGIKGVNPVQIIEWLITHIKLG